MSALSDVDFRVLYYGLSHFFQVTVITISLESVTVTLAVTRFAPGSADCDYNYAGRRVSEANVKISWTWTSYSRSPNLTNARYRTLRKGRRER